MEKFWKEPSQYEIYRCFEILNTESLIEKETYRKFAILLFEIAKKQLGCHSTQLRFIEDERNNLGFSSTVNDTVTLNLNKMEKQTLFKTVSTIYHELTHIHQDKFAEKKTVGSRRPAEFPYISCRGDERFLPASILGISPFLFYYTSQHEKQARDVGSECAMELFVALNKLAQTQNTKNGTIRLIERCINQVQTRWDRENLDNDRATAQIKEFLRQNPNFVELAFNRIKQEFFTDAMRVNPMSKERFQIENRFASRVGALVLMGCDDNLKSHILNYVSSNFVFKSEVFNVLVSVSDSPYSTTTKTDLDILFKFADQVGCPKDTLLSLLVNWDKNYINETVFGITQEPKPQSAPRPFKIPNPNNDLEV